MKKEPLKKRVLTYAVITAAAIVLLIINGQEPFVIIFTAVVMFAFVGISAIAELRSRKKDETLEKSLQDGTFQTSEKWQSRYESYVRKHGFERVKQRTMRTSLKDRFRSAFGYILVPFGVMLAVAAAMMSGENYETRVLCAAVGIGIIAYGVYRCTIHQVREFFRTYSDEIDEIEQSYLNGKMLTFRRSRDPLQNSGINIGDDYVVYYDKDRIYAVRRSDIISADTRVQRTKYYGGDMYTGSRDMYYLDITTRGESDRVRSVELNEFQTHMAAEELNSKVNNE